MRTHSSLCPKTSTIWVTGAGTGHGPLDAQQLRAQSGLSGELRRRRVECLASLHQDDAAMGKLRQHGEVFVDDHDRDAFVAKRAYRVPDFTRDQWRQTLCRLVQNKESRVGHQ